MTVQDVGGELVCGDSQGAPNQGHEALCVVNIAVVGCPVQARAVIVVGIVDEIPQHAGFIDTNDTNMALFSAQRDRQVFGDDRLGAAGENGYGCFIVRQNNGHMFTEAGKMS